MKAAVIYKSKSGYTKNYAQWISETLGAELLQGTEVKIENLNEYNTLIFGGGLYASGINGIKAIKKSINRYPTKNIIVFVTGASPGREEEIDSVFKRNFTEQEQGAIKFFYYRGGFDYSKCSAIDKVLMKMLEVILKNKKELSPDERGMLNAYKTPMDFTKKENTNELIDYVMSL
ncbi:MAG: flavodoxin domain-containing protein [Eubacteriales bacterium]|nr:flavodoxin domain-containing protein [Eubacteriales bacterium]